MGPTGEGSPDIKEAMFDDRLKSWSMAAGEVLIRAVRHSVPRARVPPCNDERERLD